MCVQVAYRGGETIRRSAIGIEYRAAGNTTEKHFGIPFEARQGLIGQVGNDLFLIGVDFRADGGNILFSYSF